VTDAAFIRDYFLAEKHGALLFMLAGVAAIALAAWLLHRRSAWRGMAVPLVAVGLIQLGVGTAVYVRSDAQSAQLQQWHRDDVVKFKAAEVPRMRTVLASFERYKSIELGLLAFGMALVVLLRNRPFWLAFGFGLVMQAGFMLALDFFAQARAQAYFNAVLGA
jgi:uncharacterized membrane protein YczE